MTILHPRPLNATISNADVSQYMLDLLKQLTLEEKVALLCGRDFSTTRDVPRLNIPSLKTADSTSAVKGANLHNPVPTACFPNTAALAASWDRELLWEMGKAVAGQAKYKAAQIVLGPTVNIHRDPRAGRNFEAFSEDPVLSGQLAAALVSGIQSTGMAACLKHFVCNDSETVRKKYNSIVNERTLREIYLAPFQWVIREAAPVLLMSAYNKVNGTYACETPLYKEVVCNEWGFQGSFMSDWYGTESTAAALEAGLDLEMPGPSKTRGNNLIKDVISGRVSNDLIDQRVLGILKVISRTKEVHSTANECVGEDKATNMLIRRIASSSMVLLKNDKSVLPLNITQAPKIAIIGQPSITYCGGGGSASGTPQYFQRPYDCIKNIHPKPDLVNLSPGVELHKCIPMVPTEKITAKNGSSGVDVIYYNDDVGEPILSELQSHAIVFMLGHLKPGLKETGFTYEMTTFLTPETTGSHTFAVLTTGAFHLFIDDEEVMAKSEPDMSVEDFLFEPQTLEARCSVSMKAKQAYSVKLIAKSRRQLNIDEPTPHSAQLGFLEEFSEDHAIEEAVQLAANSDVAIVFAGRHAEWESEGSDMESILLPKGQDRLIKSVAGVSSKTVVVLYGGNPFDVREWINDVQAVVFAHYPGQENGTALTDVLTGLVNPSGKLPMSWPYKIEDVPSFGNFPARLGGSGPEINYEEGLKIGYRYYWAQGVESPAMWDFGFGLSYTRFAFEGLKVKSRKKEGEDNIIEVEVTVRNEGALAGAEVVQVYIEDVEASVWRPWKELKAFDKVFLEPGETRIVRSRMLEKYALSFWDEISKQWVAEKGDFRVHVGGLSAIWMLEESFSWTGV